MVNNGYLTITILMADIRDIAKGIDIKNADLFQRQDIAIENSGRQEFFSDKGS